MSRQPGAWVQAAVRDLAGLQDGRPADLLHQPHAHQHEQAEDAASKVIPRQTPKLRGTFYLSPLQTLSKSSDNKTLKVRRLQKFYYTVSYVTRLCKNVCIYLFVYYLNVRQESDYFQ